MFALEQGPSGNPRHSPSRVAHGETLGSLPWAHYRQRSVLRVCTRQASRHQNRYHTHAGKERIGAQIGHHPPPLLGLTPHVIQSVLRDPRETQMRAPLSLITSKKKKKRRARLTDEGCRENRGNGTQGCRAGSSAALRSWRMPGNAVLCNLRGREQQLGAVGHIHTVETLHSFGSHPNWYLQSHFQPLPEPLLSFFPP